MLLSDRFVIGEILGQGGMGQVFAAHDRLKDQDVALKVLSPQLMASAHARERFLAEARICCDLSHDNIVRVYDLARSGPHIYFTMERLYGSSLRQAIEQCKQEQRLMPLDQVMHIARQLLTALRYAHGRNVVHRDIKPENIWLCADAAKTVKVMDFGIARAVVGSDLTRTGMAMGTAYYVAPEQRVSAKNADARADQYSLGVVLYELLTDLLPMGSTQSLEQLRRDLPKRHASALMRAMSPKPDQRWPSLTELSQELQSQQQPIALLSGVGAAIVVALLAAAYWPRPQPPAVPAPELAIPAKPTERKIVSADPTTFEPAAATATDQLPPEPVPASSNPSASVAAPKITQQQRPEPLIAACSLPVGSTAALLEQTSQAALAAGTATPLSGFRDRLRDGSCGPVMIVIPAGEFLMGSPDSEAGRAADEGPQRRVTIGSHALAQTETTFDDYERFLRDHPRWSRPLDYGWGRGNRPVIDVAWSDATAYAEWLSEQTGARYRLPTEAEWEYAARAGTTTATPFGAVKCISVEEGNFAGYLASTCTPWDPSVKWKSQPVAAYPANSFKLYDLAGNVREWVQDCYRAVPRDARVSPESDRAECVFGVVRGDTPRSADRSFSPLSYQSLAGGFRLARDL